MIRRKAVLLFLDDNQQVRKKSLPYGEVREQGAELYAKVLKSLYSERFIALQIIQVREFDGEEGDEHGG